MGTRLYLYLWSISVKSSVENVAGQKIFFPWNDLGMKLKIPKNDLQLQFL